MFDLSLAENSGLFSFIWWIFILIASWKVYVKMGEPGWKGFIPIYRDYVLYDKVWTGSYAFLYLACYVLGQGLSGIGMGIFGVIFILGYLVVAYTCFVRLCKAFSKGKLFALGLLILQPIFLLILGFGSSEFHPEYIDD